LTKIFERVSEGKVPLLKGPETPIVHPINGDLYVVTEEANLLLLTDFEKQPLQKAKEGEGGSYGNILTAKSVLAADLGMGRPLGGKFTYDGKSLYIADTLLGLIRVNIKNNKEEDSTFRTIDKVQIVASFVTDKNGKQSRILYANDVDIGPVTGHVYFTDSTDIAPERIGTRTWDTMTGFKHDYFRGKSKGRLLRYDPQIDKVDILAENIWFANGVAVVDKDESSIMISETSLARTLRYYLKGPKKGSLEVMSSKFPGYPDGGDCSFETNLCFAPMPSTALPIFVKLGVLPESFNAFFRTLCLMLPVSVLLKIKPVKYGGVVEMPVGDNDDNSSKSIRILQDPFGKEIGMLTGVATFENKLYLGSLKNEFIGMFEYNDE